MPGELERPDAFLAKGAIVDIDVFPADELIAVFRVLRTALNPSGPLDAPETTFLDTFSRITGHRWSPGLMPIGPEEIHMQTRGAGDW